MNIGLRGAVIAVALARSGEEKGGGLALLLGLERVEGHEGVGQW
jgi:hypothetical protein